jgi:hypothetical protein
MGGTGNRNDAGSGHGEAGGHGAGDSNNADSCQKAERNTTTLGTSYRHSLSPSAKTTRPLAFQPVGRHLTYNGIY